MNRGTPTRLSRRAFLTGALATGGVAAVSVGVRAADQPPHVAHDHGQAPVQPTAHTGHGSHEGSGLVGEVDLSQFDPTQFLTHFDWGRESTTPDGRTLREWDIIGGRQGDRGGAGRVLPRLDLQRPGAGPHVPLPAGRPAALSLPQCLVHAAHDPLPRHPPAEHGRRDADGPDRRRVRLRVRGQAIWAAPVPLPRHAAQAAHPQGAVRRLHHRSARRPAAGAARW